jgi:nitrate/nitrite transport system permease protein
MNAVPLRKDTFMPVAPANSSEAGDTLAENAAVKDDDSMTTPARLPFGMTLPNAGAAFEAAWPPLVGIGGFLMLWALMAPLVQTSLGALPGPGDVWTAFLGLIDEYRAARVAASESVAAGYAFTGPPTFVDQIITSLETVAAGFGLATLAAVPLGLVAGMSKRVNAAINPLVQVMRPVSPLAWLPIVTMVVSASMVSDDPTLAKELRDFRRCRDAVLTMADADQHRHRHRQHRQGPDQCGPRAAARLVRAADAVGAAFGAALYLHRHAPVAGHGLDGADRRRNARQNPGLGKFVWDEFQNGSEKSLARIMVAVVVIGLIGFVLDRVMMAMQAFVSRNRTNLRGETMATILSLKNLRKRYTGKAGGTPKYSAASILMSKKANSSPSWASRALARPR